MGRQRNGNDGWVTCSIRRPLLEAVKSFVRGRSDPTITKHSQFVDLAVREKLERDGGGEAARCC